MKKLFMVIPLVFLLCFTFGGQQTETELPTYTPEQCWERTSSQLTVSFVGAIAYAKSLEQSAEQYGEYLAKLFAPSWGEQGSGTLNIIRGVHRNFMMWTESEFEIIESSDVSITARSNRPWAKYFGENKTLYGVTLEEFETCFGVFNRLVAEYLGLGYKDEVKEGWLYMTFSIKK